MRIIRVKDCGECPWGKRIADAINNRYTICGKEKRADLPKTGVPEWCPLDKE